MHDQSLGGHPFRQLALITKGNSDRERLRPTNYPTGRHESRPTIAALYVQPDGLRERFLAKTKRDPETGCLLWTACKNKKGYGTFSVAKSIPAYAHRTAWAIHYGFWPHDCLLHSCDNPSCVEITHLREGSRADNNSDMRLKGRERHKGATGESNHSSKLTRLDVEAIRESTKSCSAAAKEFGVSKSLISQVRKRLVWRHV